MNDSNASLDDLCINTIRFLSIDAVQQANSGHPGMPMGAAPMAYVLWNSFLNHNPGNADWPDRDRFVLSAGHGSSLLYSLLHLTGYGLTLDDIKNFRQWGSKTAGHPEYGHAAGIETTTGPLGQGIANAVGMALAEAHLAGRFNKPGHEIINHYTYAIAGDGDLMEGLSHEASSLAGHLGLGKLICLYDDNHICIEGPTELTFSDDTVKRFEAYGWQVLTVTDGTNLGAIAKALEMAKGEAARPTLIAVRTNIGYGSPNRQDKAQAHGEPLGDEEIKLTRENLGWPEERFHIPAAAADHFGAARIRGQELEDDWQGRLAAYAGAYPQLAAELKGRLAGELPADWDADIPVFAADAKGMATRASSGKVLNAIAGKLPALAGGSADLAPSNKTMINNEGVMAAGSFANRNIHFGVREHAMGGVMNGMALHGGLIPYGGTFLIFSDYLRPSIRLAALMKQQAIYVFTHDSIGVGEDGPTHQPIEHLASLRAMPGLNVIRPCDANECAEAWRQAIQARQTPTVLALTRQGLPTLDRTAMGPAADLARGGYVLRDTGAGIDVILLATGSEVPIALAAADTLAAKGLGVRVVSMPCWEFFEAQSREYKDSVLLPAVKARVSIEAGVTQGWQRYVGDGGTVIGLDHFGASAPIKDLYENFGLTPDKVVEAALALTGQ